MRYLRSLLWIAVFCTLIRLHAVEASECSGTNVVATCTDATLRAAMGAGGIVTLCCNGTIVLTNTIRVSRHVALDGAGQNVTISGGGSVRLFEVDSGVHFSVTNLVLADGAHSGAPFGPGRGGAILNDEAT